MSRQTYKQFTENLRGFLISQEKVSSTELANEIVTLVEKYIRSPKSKQYKSPNLARVPKYIKNNSFRSDFIDWRSKFVRDYQAVNTYDFIAKPPSGYINTRAIKYVIQCLTDFNNLYPKHTKTVEFYKSRLELKLFKIENSN